MAGLDWSISDSSLLYSIEIIAPYGGLQYSFAQKISFNEKSIDFWSIPAAQFRWNSQARLHSVCRKGMFSILNSQNKIHKLTFINDENSSITIRSDLFQRILLKCNFFIQLSIFMFNKVFLWTKRDENFKKK